jgi:DNA polymerase-3 subunit gamma/tau
VVGRQALYRTYRPRRFRDVVGQDVEVRLLREAVRHQQLTHAYLLAGPRGTGKTSVARILAQAATCHAPEDGEPCGHCASCRAAESQSHLDIVEIDGASNRGIDEVRDLRELVLHAPAMGTRKVYIVDEVHMLTEPAFNAFLKTLEEPPPHVLFIFATTEPHKVPITVLSRCQRYDFHRLDPRLIAERLADVARQEGVAADPEALRRIAEASDGGLRDALSLMDQILATGEVTVAQVDEMLGALDAGQLQDLVEAMHTGDVARVLSLTDALYAAGRDARQMLKDVARHLRDRWAEQVLGGSAAAVPGERWVEALECLAEAEGRLRGSFPPQLVIELGLVKASRALAGSWAAGDLPLRAEPPLPGGAEEPTKPPASPAASTPRAPAGRAPTVSAVAADVLSLDPVLDLLRRRRQLTAALFRHATLSVEGDTAVVQFRYPAHYAMLDDEASGHRQEFLDCFRAVYGDRRVSFALAESEEKSPSPLDRIRRVFGPDVPIRIRGRGQEDGAS